jgi:selenocysteine lyase/cysteine desulfurase
MDAAALRAEFPVLERIAYLNAGTCGPLPRAAADATREVLDTALHEGRARDYHDIGRKAREEQRAAYAGLLGADPAEVALTTCTSDGIGRVLAGLDLRAGDEILTSDAEHPGLLGPLSGVAAHRGVRVRTAPLARLHEHVGPRTVLVACSHVGWVSGDLAPRELGELDIPVLLDGAQGIGAVPVSVSGIGCAFYAGSGQKWLCGPVGTGMLWVHPAWMERVAAHVPTYLDLADPAAGLESPVHPDARRYDAAAPSVEAAAAAAAAVQVLAGAGWDACHDRAAALAAMLADELLARGYEVAPRAATTLVSWVVPDPPATRERLAAEGIVVRDFPGRPLVRASVGAWNDERDLERLLDAL